MTRERTTYVMEVHCTTSDGFPVILELTIKLADLTSRERSNWKPTPSWLDNVYRPMVKRRVAEFVAGLNSRTVSGNREAIQPQLQRMANEVCATIPFPQ